MKGELNGERVQVVKGNGCNAKIVSFGFVGDHREMFRIVKNHVTMRISKKDFVEETSKLIFEGTLRIVTHTYESNWVVASCIYDIRIGMPCMLPMIQLQKTVCWSSWLIMMFYN